MTIAATPLRAALVALLAGTVLILLGTAASASVRSPGAAEEQMAGLINADRRAKGLPNLSMNVQLTGVARAWTPTMAKANKISHNPNMARAVAGSWTRLGENVGVSRPGGDTPEAQVKRLHAAFMNSPAHKANVLGDFTQIGIGTQFTSDGSMWVTVMFMKGGESRPNAAVAESTSLSRKVFAAASASGRRADYVVLGRAEVFADALGGAGLAGKRAPVLFTNGPTTDDPDPALHSAAAGEIDRILGGRGTVYLLGGTGAVSARAERELAGAGYSVKRLSGPSRIETSVRVAEEIVRVHGAPKHILIARAEDWPDAVTGGAYAAATGSPLVLTGRDSLHGATKRFLDANRGAAAIALGGSAALSDATVRDAKATRIAGRDRAGTAVAVAQQLWGRTSASSGDRFGMAPGYAGDAWAYALAMAPWSAANSGPQLLVSHEVPAAVSDYLQGLGYRGNVKGDVFSASSVPQSVRDQARRLVNGG